MEQPIPRRIEENPSLQDGQYDAVIRDISLQRSSRDTQILVLVYLPDQLTHLITRLQASKRSYNGQNHRRLVDFCSAINVDARLLLGTPAKVKGRRLRIKTKRSDYDADGTTHWFSDIVGFMPLGSEAERQGELGMATVPHSGLAD